MKTILVCLALLLPYNPTRAAQQSQILAVNAFPDLAKKDSPINKRFLELLTAARANDPALDRDAYWPLRLARQAAAELTRDWPVSSIEAIQIEEAKRLAALRSEGVGRKREESIIRIASLVKQRGVLEGKDSVEQQRIDVRIAQIHQEMDKVETEAAFSRWQDEMALTIKELQTALSIANSKGEFLKSDETHERLIKLSDQLRNSQRLGEIWTPSEK